MSMTGAARRLTITGLKDIFKRPFRKIHMLILGISAFYHDSAVSLIRDGEIIFAAQEERFSRKKHDSHPGRERHSRPTRLAGTGRREPVSP